MLPLERARGTHRRLLALTSGGPFSAASGAVRGSGSSSEPSGMAGSVRQAGWPACGKEEARKGSSASLGAGMPGCRGPKPCGRFKKAL